MFLILMFLWFFDLITFKHVFLFWVGWVLLNVVIYGITGAVFYATFIAPLLSLVTQGVSVARKKKPMQWEVRKHPDGGFGVYLKQEFCRTDEPVCYGVCRTIEGAEYSVERKNKLSIEEFEQANSGD